MKAVYLAAVLLLAGAGWSAPAWANPVLTWTQPTTWETPPVNASGVPTPAAPLVLDKNKIYRGTKADGTDFALLVILKPAVTTYTDPAPLAGQNCYAITAAVVDVGSAESSWSAVVCTTFTPPSAVKPKPKSPTNVTAK